jgi:hypothetical protein
MTRRPDTNLTPPVSAARTDIGAIFSEQESERYTLHTRCIERDDGASASDYRVCYHVFERPRSKNSTFASIS